MLKRIIIILALAVVVFSGGCQEVLMPDQVSVSTFKGPMGNDFYIFGVAWDVPKLGRKETENRKKSQGDVVVSPEPKKVQNKEK